MSARLLPLPALLALAGCASTAQVRGLADRTGVFVTSLDTGTSGFIARQDRLNEQNAARLDQLGATGAPDRAAVRQQRLAWQDAGDEARLKAFEAASAHSAEEIVAALDARPRAALPIGADVLDGYAAAAKALAAAATRPTPLAALRELADFGRAVADDYAALKDAADKAGATAAAATQQADAAAATAGQAAATPR